VATTLEQILARTAEDLKARKTAANAGQLERKAAARKPRGFIAGLRAAAATRPAVIAELKKASPSKGLIRPDFHPDKLASSLEEAGAAVLSVLTNEPFFQGSLTNLEIASSTVKIPCLRKDFIVDPFQVLEARACGADAILLILAALPADSLLAELQREAAHMELDVLCEVHSREEMDRATAHGFQLIGVNSRDLHTFTKNPDLLYELASQKPANVLLVAESGIRDGAEIEKLRAAGFEAFLIGEALMKQPDPAATLAAMLGRESSVRI